MVVQYRNPDGRHRMVVVFGSYIGITIQLPYDDDHDGSYIGITITLLVTQMITTMTVPILVLQYNYHKPSWS
jgi:hypothetical protein